MGKLEGQEDLFPEDRNPRAPQKGSSGDAVTIKAEVVAPPQYNVSRAGKPYTLLPVRDEKGKSLVLMCFGGAAETARGFAVGDKLSVTGKVDEKEEGKLIAFGLYRQGDKVKESPKARVVREYGSIEAYKESCSRHWRQQAEKGLVPVKSELGALIWERREHCVYWGGKWQKKIDFLMDQLGPEVVKKEIKGITGQVQLALQKGPAEMFRAKADWATHYRAWLDARVEEITGDKKRAAIKQTEEEDLFP